MIHQIERVGGQLREMKDVFDVGEDVEVRVEDSPALVTRCDFPGRSHYSHHDPDHGTGRNNTFSARSPHHYSSTVVITSSGLFLGYSLHFVFYLEL